MLTSPSARYLVTGGAGFIGSNIVEVLVEEGASVRVLDNFSTGRRENLAEFLGAIELIEGSITNPATCASVCEGIDFVLHQAALPSVPRSVADPAASHEACATGTLNMLVAARDAGVKRFVYAGSSSAYGDTPTLPKVESMPTLPRSPYAVAKLMGEQYCRVFSLIFGLETVMLRYFNIFGPRQDPASQYSAVIPLFITKALTGESPTIDGDGEQTRDFTYVQNAVRANLLACTADAGDVSGEVFNLGCGERISVNRLWEAIQENTGAAVEPVNGPARDGDVRDSRASLDKSQTRMGYESTVSWAEGLRRTVEWLGG
ncbi:MAG: SDR family oxidoreductase, partial [Gemmatimonadota bacterium]|nr:SDR family oxidoreductase [Gemmatimonadota bacterium]